MLDPLPTLTCSRRLRFCAGHRVLGHENKCGSWHGHEYEVIVTASADSLDGIGRVIDFSVLKERIGGWIDKNWDHGFLLFENDSELVRLSEVLGARHKTFQLPYNPTAENLALYLLTEICPDLLEGTQVKVTNVVVHETTNCFAEAKSND